MKIRSGALRPRFIASLNLKQYNNKLILWKNLTANLSTSNQWPFLKSFFEEKLISLTVANKTPDLYWFDSIEEEVSEATSS